jgi:hypothetical protein
MIVDKPKYISALCAFLGSILLVVAVYLFINRIIFLTHAISSSAPIVAVSHEYAAKGKGSVLAYVPTVRVQDSAGSMLDVKVDAFNEEPVYAIGQQLAVSCNPTRGCVEDTFFAKWGACLIDLLISLVLFSPLLAWKSGLWQSNDKITGLHLQRDA